MVPILTSASDRTAVPPAKCRSCNRPLDSPLFCGNCHTLHPAAGLTHFAVLGLSPSFDINLDELRRKYLYCSRCIHPDHHSAGGADADLSLHTAAQLNEAYRVLQDPVLRAEHLLALAGGRSSAEDKSAPPDVLAQTMLLREELEEARAANDNVGLATLRKQVQSLREQALQVVAGLARELPGSDDTRQRLREQLNAVKYYRKLLEQL
jgi:molecular chaperone HscB